MDDIREYGNNEMENPPAPPYEPSLAHSPEYHTPTIQLATEPVIPAMDEDCEDAHNNEEAEVPRAADNNDNSERYWCTINSLD
jgi:hypothetical protein